MSATRRLVAVAVAFVVVGAGCRDGVPMPSGAARDAPAIRVRVETADVRAGTVSRAESSTGTVRPWQRATVIAPVGGELVEMAVDVGDRVEAQAVLARVDDSKQRIAVAQAAAQYDGARADLEFATSDLERIRAMVERGSLPPLALDEAVLRRDKAEAGAESASAALRSARRNLADTELRAPFAGTITQRRVDAGTTVSPGTPVLDVVDLSRIRVRVGATGHEAASLERGDTAMVEISDLGGETLPVTVGSIAAVANDLTGLYEVELRGENPDERVRGGMLARVELPRRSVRPVVVVPRSAITRRDGAVVAFVVVDGVARRRAVRTGLYDASSIEVLHGLEVGATVATSALHALAEGVLVEPAPRSASVPRDPVQRSSESASGSSTSTDPAPRRDDGGGATATSGGSRP